MKHVDPAGLDCVALDSVFDPNRRRALVMLPGSSLADMAAEAYPDLPEARRDILVATVDGHVVPRVHWRLVKPKAGAVVVFKPAPGNDTLRSVLTIAVAVAAIAAGQFYGPLLANSLVFGAGAAGSGALGSVLSATISATVLLAGTLLINALVPPRSDKKDKPTYSISGLQNQFTPDGVVPLILGKVRYAPPYAAKPFTGAIGDERYVTAPFLCGYGPLMMRDWCIGTTPLERFKDVEFEQRAGYTADPPLTLYTQQVIEEALSIELKQAAIPTGGPQIRTTALDVTGCEVDISYPSGIYLVNEDGENESFTVVIGVRYRKTGTETWTVAPNISATGRMPKTFTRTTAITFPERGRYDIELTRITESWDEVDQSRKKTKRSGRSVWSVLRGFRPEYPIVFDKPLALAACKIRATGQLNGTIDALNAELSSICPDWDAPTQSWITRETNNPASLFRYVLTGPAISYALTTAEIAALGDWHAFCVAKGLTYNRAHDYEASVLEVLSDVAAAGRASPHDTGTTWGVVIDRALDTIAAHISPKNSWGFQGERPYSIFPDAFRVRFLDETNRFEPAERIVPWPGFVGTPKVVEKLEMPGVTNPGMVWKETRRRQYELIHRADTFTVNQDWESLVVTRGDRTELSHDVLDRVQVAGKVGAVDSPRVVLDEPVTFEAGKSYACRFRRFDGSSLLRSVTGTGETRILTLTGPGLLPAEGDLALFGTAGSESLSCTVRGVEAMENMCARLTLVPHAPQIEALVDAEVPPVWSGRAGGDAQAPSGAITAPIITDVVSGRGAASEATDADPNPVIVYVRDGASGGRTIATHQVQSRLTATTTWSAPASAPAATGTVTVRGYAKGAQIDLQARSVASDGTVGPWSATTTHTVAASDPPSPTGLTVTLERRTVSGGQSVVFLRLVCTAPTRNDLVLSGRYRPVGGTAWSSFSRDTDNAYSLVAGPVGDGTSYEVQGRLQTGSGASFSEWIAASGSPIAATADPTAPAAPTYSSANRNATNGQVSHAGKFPASANVRSVRLRRAQGFGKVLADATALASYAGGPNQDFANWLADTVDLGLYQYWLEALNGSGVASPAAGPLSVIQAPQLGNVLASPFDLSAAAWTKANTTASLSGTGPDGQATSLLAETTATGQHYASQAASGAAGKWRAAFGLKVGGGRTRAALYLYDSALSSNVRCTIDLAAGTVSAPATTGANVTSPVADITKVSADTFIVSLTGQVATANPVARLFVLNDTGATTYAGDTTKGLFVWGGTLAPQP